MASTVPDVEELKQVFVQEMGAVALFDTEGRYIFINEGWKKNYGDASLPYDSVIGRDVREIVPDSLVYDVIKTEKPAFGMCFWPASGDQIFIAANYIPLFWEGKLAAVAMYTTFNSIDEANAFYASLEKSQSQLRYYKKEVSALQQAKYSIDDIVGQSPCIQELKSHIMRAANTVSNVLIEGETGCGKELVAHAIHNLSQRSGEPFIELNCTAIPGNLAESELFGYESGAFTGASKGGRIGKFEMANGGSLFLDEINTLPMEMQPKLLRVLQEREVEHIGGSKSIPIDVRMIAATNKPLADLVDAGSFRRDLFYRLNVVSIRVPPLRERKEDIPILCRHFIQKLNQTLHTEIDGISEDAIELFTTYSWPGNVRELQNVLECAMNWKTRGMLWSADFSEYFLHHVDPVASVPAPADYRSMRYSEVMDAFELQYIREVLQHFSGNKKKAAEAIGLSRAMFYRKLEKHGIK